MFYKSHAKFASNVVKGRIAETLIEEMFKNSGYQVYRFGYEAILENIVQLKKKINDSKTYNRVKSIPDFLVVSPNGDLQLIEVKYRSSGEIKPEELEKYSSFWKEARFILVTSKEPHFRIAYIKSFMKDEKLWPLEEDKYTRIDPEIIKKFSEIVKIYFKE